MSWLAEVLGSQLAANALAWVLGGSVAGALVARLVVSIKSGYVQGVVQRAYAEVRDAVLMVHQTYVSEITAGKADGTLTDEEKAKAKADAIAAAKSYIGVKGLEALGRVLGLDVSGVEGWLGGKVEAHVAALKADAMLPKGPNEGP